jgi:hypothetical protein
LIGGKVFLLPGPCPIRIADDTLRIVTELLPIIEKELFKEYFTASIAVKVPTNAIMPNAIIKIVSEARNF